MRALPALLLLCLVCAVAFAEEAPRRKSGLWEISMSSPQMPAPMVTRQCVDEKTDNLARQPGPQQQKCSRQSVRHEGGNVIVESVCQVQGSTATTHGVFSGDFSSAYKGDMTTKFSPPLYGSAESKVSFQARLTGPCAPGQKPGDVSVQGMPGGVRPAGGMSAEDARRMADEMVKKYQK